MKRTIQLGTLSATNLGITFLFQWYILTKLGPSAETDAFIAGNTVPQIFLAIISGSLMHVLVPIFASETEESIEQSSWTLSLAVGILFTILASLIFILAPYLIPAIVPGFSKEAKTLTIEVTKINLVGMILGGINCVQWSRQNADQKFIRLELIQMLTIAIAFGLLTYTLPKFGIYAAAWISVIRIALQTALHTLNSGKFPRINSDKEMIVGTWKKLSPLLLGASYYKLDPLVDRALLSNTGNGGISLYFLAQQLYGAASQIINNAFIAPLIPNLSRLHKQNNIAIFRKTYKRQITILSIASLAVFIATTIAGHAILSFFIGHGNVTTENINNLWILMICLGGMFIGGTIGQLTSNCFYAMGDTRTPTKLGVYSFTVYVPAKFFFFQWLGAPGLALSTSVYFIVNLWLQHFFIIRKLKNQGALHII